MPNDLFIIVTIGYIVSCFNSSFSFPTMRYKLCYSRTPQSCFPSDFASNSTFVFGDLTVGAIFYDEKPRWPSLSVSCTATKPLRWILDVMTVE